MSRAQYVVLTLVVVVALFGVWLIVKHVEAERAAEGIKRDLDLSQNWLAHVLPDSYRGTGLKKNTYMEADLEYLFEGFTFTIKRGIWRNETSSDPFNYVAPENVSGYELVLKPQPGLYFIERDMSQAEVNAWRTKHPPSGAPHSDPSLGKMGAAFDGSVTDVALKDVSLSSILVSATTIDGSWGYKDEARWAFTGDDSLEKASRVEKAFEHVAELCGATREPF